MRAGGADELLEIFNQVRQQAADLSAAIEHDPAFKTTSGVVVEPIAVTGAGDRNP